MTERASCSYVGTVVHKRVTPKYHAFSYNVFALSLDVDELTKLDGELRFFSYNRWNVLSFFDRDHGAGDVMPVGQHVRQVLSAANLSDASARVTLLCYPRLLGFVFNPLSVYFCHDADGRLGVVIYEVSNTFGERKSYLITVAQHAGELVVQSCEKELYVSPFTVAAGRYDFHVVPPGDRVLIGVDLRDASGPVLKTHFCGARQLLSDWSIVRLVTLHPFMTLRVVAGIHLQALRLWLKGVPLVARHASPAYSFTVVHTPPRDPAHV
jgi:uncharacterized protein